MPKTKLNVSLLFANIHLSVALILELLAIGLPYWSWDIPRVGHRRVWYGLWDVCVSVNFDDYTCRAYGEANIALTNWQGAVGATEIVAAVCMFVAMVSGLVAHYYLKTSLLLYVVATTLSIFGAVSGLIAIIIYAVKFGEATDQTGEHLHVGFYLALLAILLALIGALFYFLSKPVRQVR